MDIYIEWILRWTDTRLRVKGDSKSDMMADIHMAGLREGYPV